MSKRPSTTNALLSRLSRPADRLRNLPIWSKLGLIMIVPTIATILVGTNGLVGHIQDANDADGARTLANLSESAEVLVHGLQNERAAAVILLGTGDAGAKQSRLTGYRDTRSPVDTALRPYTQHATAASDLPDNFANLLRTISQNLTNLSTVRSQVEGGKISLTAAKDSYQLLINNLLTIGDSAAQLAGDTQLSDRMRAAAAVSREKEFLSQERTVVLNAFSLGELTPKLKRDFIATQTGQQQALQSFQSVASPAERELYDQAVSGSALREANTYAGAVEDMSGINVSALPFDATDWDTAMVGQAELLRNVEVVLDRNMVEKATDLRDEVTRKVLIETGVLLGMLLLAILFAWLVARSMARSLRELRHGALSVAQYGLPQAVARLRDPALSNQMSPQQVAAQIAEPLPVRSKDEFGQVTEAFNAVHLEAVRTAAEQAALRSSVATMFVNLARRSQILVDRLIGHLDRLERGEEDPDALAELFQLDHLATRMRRNDENLLVLAGADSTRVQREPAALIDVLRAAQSEVEHYTRIEFGTIDRDIEVAAHAVNDLVHLLAELFDNATAFSPPDSHVVVEARRVGDRANLYVEDRGIGISAEQLAELNERLATPPLVDVAVSRMMGLVVVSRLAARHGVKVELRRAAERGTVADVMLPASVLVPRALVGRSQNAARDVIPTSAAPAQWSPRGQLALESGPSTTGGPPGFEGRGSYSDAPPPGTFVDPTPATQGGLLGSAASSRTMPAWSDLTGSTGVNGGNGSGSAGTNGAFTPNGAGYGGSAFQAPPETPDGEAYAPPFTPRAPDAPGTGPLPQRRATDPWTVEGEVAEGGPAGPIPRQLPRPPQGPVSTPPYPPASVSPPPAWPPIVPATGGDDEETGANPPAVPEELAAALDMTAELPKVVRNEGRTEESGTPAEQPAEPARPAGAPRMDVASTLRGAAPAARPARPRMPDETMELPIFRELESAWFRTRRPATAPPAAASPAAAGSTPASASVSAPPAAPSSAPPAPSSAPSTPSNAPPAPAEVSPVPSGVSSAQPAAHDSSVDEPAADGPAAPARFEAVPGSNGTRQSTVNGTTTGSDPTMASTSMSAGAAGGAGPSWQTAADDGWRAASAATQVPVAETTQAGLPKRVPMAQLVPGGVERPSAAAQRRSPEAVRGLLSAYHRGVQRGRSEPKDDDPVNPEPSTAGPQPQGGKEQEA